MTCVPRPLSNMPPAAVRSTNCVLRLVLCFQVSIAHCLAQVVSFGGALRSLIERSDNPAILGAAFGPDLPSNQV